MTKTPFQNFFVLRIAKKVVCNNRIAIPLSVIFKEPTSGSTVLSDMDLYVHLVKTHICCGHSLSFMPE